MTETRRAIAPEVKEQSRHDRFASTLVIAASFITPVRLAKDENIGRSSPRLTTVIMDCVAVARMILNQIAR